jgi:hypothetical protein
VPGAVIGLLQKVNTMVSHAGSATGSRVQQGTANLLALPGISWKAIAQQAVIPIRTTIRLKNYQVNKLIILKFQAMFTHLKNIDTAFKHIRQFSLLLIIGNVFTMCFCIYKSTHVINQAYSRIHILYNGKILEALAADRKVNLPVELRDHIKTFHQNFFDLSPDDKAIRETIGKALYLADESAKRQYDNLREAGYYNNLMSANISQKNRYRQYGLVRATVSLPVYLLCHGKTHPLQWDRLPQAGYPG